MCRGAGGRSLMLLLGRLLHAFAERGVLPRRDMRDLGLRFVAHSLSHAGRGQKHILRMHRVARLWLAHQHVLTAALGELLSKVVDAATSNGVTHRIVRVSTLCLLRQIFSRNAEHCACSHGQPGQCQAMLIYCVRALGDGASQTCDLPTYLTAQRVLHIIATSALHAAGKIRVQSSKYQQVVDGLTGSRCNLQTELHNRRDAATLDKSIIQRFEVDDNE